MSFTSDLTIKERVSLLEAKQGYVEQILTKLDHLEVSVSALTKEVNEMRPIIQQVTNAKIYGSWTFKILAWLGGVTVATIAMWPKIKSFLHYLFN